MFRPSIILILFVLLSAGLCAQTAVEGEAFAEVVEAITATESSQMNFGRFSPEVSGGQVILSPDGVRTTQGSVVLSGGLAQPGIFVITGAPDASFSIQLPAQPTELMLQGSNKTMTVDAWVSDPPAGNSSGILSGGQEIVSIGATLLVGPPQDNPVGIYTGTFSLTFAYD